MSVSFQPNNSYHVFTHANGSENLFRTEENYNHFLKKYAEHIYPVAETFAYCLMPNHLHLGIKIRQEQEILGSLNLEGFQNLGGFSDTISQRFSNLFNAYTKAYNKMYDRKGSLFIPNFKRKEITNDRYFLQLIIYIHHNPIHHGFVKYLLDWPYSSIHAYIWDKPSKLNRHYLRDWIGNKKQLLLLHENLDFDPNMFEF